MNTCSSGAAVREYSDITDLLREAVRAARIMVGNKPVSVMDTSPARPVTVHAAPDKLRRVINGLPGIAAATTDRGRIAMILCGEGENVRLTVADTGNGMHPDQVNGVDETGGRPDAVRHLRVVTELVKELSGSITVSSRNGAGTIVEVLLPIGVAISPAIS
jgi:signal transduction histidine kinase